MDQNSDQLNIDTPELVAIEMPLAGIGSRFIALLIDTLIWGAGLIVLSLVAWAFQPALQAFNGLSYQWTVAIFTLSLFASTGATSLCSKHSGTGARRASASRAFA